MKRTAFPKMVQCTTWILMIFIGSTGLSSCSSRQLDAIRNSPPTESETVTGAGSDSTRQLTSQQIQDSETSPQSNAVQISSTLRQTPQLIKTADLTLRVEDVETSLDQISGILRQKQGDLLKLDDHNSRETGDRHRYSLQLRIPQGNLNSTLDEIEALGTVKARSIQAQDVSDQLVDSQARLKNLRKSEEMVLKIMDRSGSIPDVLSASKELSTIRENIERIDAQLQSLKNRVAFSTINLSLESETASIEPQANLGTQLQNAWKHSTSAMGDLTMAFLKLGIWGIAFSPYLIALGLLLWIGRRYQLKRHAKPTPSKPETE